MHRSGTVASGAHWVQLDTAATQAKVRHHSCVGVVSNWLLQQSDHFGRTTQSRVGSSVVLLHFGHIFVLRIVRTEAGS
jgi:hypothetical protein